MYFLGYLVGAWLVGLPLLAIFFGTDDLVHWIENLIYGNWRLRSDRGQVIRYDRR